MRATSLKGTTHPQEQPRCNGWEMCEAIPLLHQTGKTEAETSVVIAHHSTSFYTQSHFSNISKIFLSKHHNIYPAGKPHTLFFHGSLTLIYSTTPRNKKTSDKIRQFYKNNSNSGTWVTQSVTCLSSESWDGGPHWSSAQ